MDLGCIDMGCVEKPRKETPVEKYQSPTEPVMSASKPGKNNKAKEVVRSSLNALNKLTSQISKPPYRKTSSPINWFPRKKMEPYLKRKIKMLQEVDGMHLTLDETLGDSNPHYSRVLREKIAIREAAEKAMKARKASMVEASWCRILQAARIGTKEAEAQLTKAEQSAAEALEAARTVGVIVSDSENHYRIETSSTTSHTVSATFESAFEVDKQVAGAVKAAFIKLASCPSINKDKFKELLHKVSENPETNKSYSDMSDFISGCESGMVDMMLSRIRCLKEDELASLATIVATTGLSAVLSSEMGNNSNQNSLSSAFENNGNNATCPPKVVPRRMSSVSWRSAKNQNVDLPSLDKFLVKRLTKLEREVLEAKNARNDELASFDGNEQKELKKEGTEIEIPGLESVLVRRPSRLEKEIDEAKTNNLKSSEVVNNKFHKGRAKQDIEEVPSLDKYLVKHLSRLEREVEEARNNRKASGADGNDNAKGKENTDVNKAEIQNYESLDKVLVKRVSRLEREKMDFREDEQMSNKPKRKNTNGGLESSEGSLDQVLVKRVSRLEREKMEFREDEQMSSKPMRKNTNGGLESSEGSLDQVMVKRVSRLEREKMEFREDEQTSSKSRPKNTNVGVESSEGSLDQIFVKRVSRLEREKMNFCGDEEIRSKPNVNGGAESSEASLDQVLVKHESRLEREKTGAVEKREEEEDRTRHSFVSRRQARERELQAAWGGLTLGNSMKLHVSKLQRDKDAWIEAEEEERKRETMEAE